MNKKGKILTAIALAGFSFAGCAAAAYHYAGEFFLKKGCKIIYLESSHKPLTGRIDIHGKEFTFLTKAKEGKLELTVRSDGDDGARFVDEGHDGIPEKVLYLGPDGERETKPRSEQIGLYRSAIFSITKKIYDEQDRKLRRLTPSYEA